MEKHEPQQCRRCKVLRKGKHVLLQKTKQQAYSYKGPLLRENPMTKVCLSHVNNTLSIFSKKQLLLSILRDTK